MRSIRIFILFLLRPFFALLYELWRWFAVIRKSPSRGVYVLIRHHSLLLVVQHSYRLGWSVPGGGLRVDEDWRAAAVRETFEEVGIRLEDKAFKEEGIVTDTWNPNAVAWVASIDLEELPEVMVDGWEILRARFVEEGELRRRMPELLCPYLRCDHE
ncbi:MAG: NUDIX hydrolase [Lentisphaerae bacterium]|nr:MAG: NUDIX hydrolase [Lentisphaerota bacterium]